MDYSKNCDMCGTGLDVPCEDGDLIEGTMHYFYATETDEVRLHRMRRKLHDGLTLPIIDDLANLPRVDPLPASAGFVEGLDERLEVVVRIALAAGERIEERLFGPADLRDAVIARGAAAFVALCEPVVASPLRMKAVDDTKRRELAAVQHSDREGVLRLYLSLMKSQRRRRKVRRP